MLRQYTIYHTLYICAYFENSSVRNCGLRVVQLSVDSLLCILVNSCVQSCALRVVKRELLSAWRCVRISTIGDLFVCKRLFVCDFICHGKRELLRVSRLSFVLLTRECCVGFTRRRYRGVRKLELEFI